MRDITFDVNLNWSGVGKHGSGDVTIGEQTIDYSGPKDMHGKGVGPSPEDLFVSGVSSCYTGTLYGVLYRAKLPVERVSVHAQGVVTGYPKEPKFSKLIVSPTIIGADTARAQEYEKATVDARNMCFVGKTIMGNVEYVVGDVHVE